MAFVGRTLEVFAVTRSHVGSLTTYTAAFFVELAALTPPPSKKQKI
jgi:hypothetical protein